MYQFKWGPPQSPQRSLPWRKLSQGQLTVCTLLIKDESTDKWLETKIHTITAARLSDDQHLVGKLIYVVRPEEKSETRFHVTTFDALLRGAENTDASVRARSAQLQGDAATLRGFCELVGGNWQQIKDDLPARMAITAGLLSISDNYLWAVRQRLQYVSYKAGKTAGLKDGHEPPRDNPSAMRAQWFTAVRRLDNQWEFNEKAVTSAADMVLLARAMSLYVDGLINQMLAVAAAGQPNAAIRYVSELENFVIFNSPSNAVRFAKLYRRGRRFNQETVQTIAAAFAAEQLMCGASSLVSLVRDHSEFRTPEMFVQLRELVTWSEFDPVYTQLSLQLQAFVDTLELACQRDDKRSIKRAAKSLKVLIRTPRTESSVAA